MGSVECVIIARPIRTERRKMDKAELMIEPAQTGILLTPEGYSSLQRELEHLTTVKRAEIADRIRESQQHGEFSEDNSELDEVKMDQAMVESRISELKAVFGNAHVIEESMIPTDMVGLGSLVTVEDHEFRDRFDVRIVMSIEADPERDLLSNESPMGQALWGHSKGEDVTFDSPDGKKRFQIVDIRR
jgi:transcription elongation factor GreA